MGSTRALAPPGPTVSPDDAAVAGSQLTAFMRHCGERTGRGFADPADFHDFSVAEYRRFWRLFVEWAGVRRDGSLDPVCTDDDCERAEFFPNVRLSYVENLLAPGASATDDDLALIACHESRPPERLTRRQLRDRVAEVAAGLRRLGLRAGDRAAAVVANDADAVVAALATAELGVTFSTAAPDMGTPAVVSRFRQLEPKILFASLGAPARLSDLVRELPSLTAVVALGDGGPPAGIGIPVHRLSDMRDGGAARFERRPFNHPLFVLFTSGTTGPPKCIVHGAGGTLVEHLKEHRLHVDLRPGDRLLFHTSAAWMMWNWQLSALATGAAIVLYDGSVAGPETLWRLVADHGVTVFGTSPPYLQLCEDSGFRPRAELDLRSLRAVLSTGAILHDWQYDWVRAHVGPLPLQSISGGTDIIGCFVLGNPNLPVHRGWIQCRSLGLDVQALPAAPGGPIGELVCRNPFPSRPLGLVGDDGTAFHAAYFEQNPPAWTHGDLIELDERGQARMHGRSDGVINVHGVRIGPAELYRALGEVPEVRDAVAVAERTADGRSRLVLLVVLREPGALDGRLVVRIRRAIARHATPLHVPELVLEVPDVPRTHSGKRSERAARDALNGDPVQNAAALDNPDSLAAIRRAADRARARPEPGPGRGEPSAEAQIVAIWEEVLGVAPIQPGDDFFDLGGTSLAAFELLQVVNERVGVELPPSMLLHARTPAALSAVVYDPAARAIPRLVRLRSGGDGRPLFLVHSIWGDVFPLRPLALTLPTRRPVWGLQAIGLDAREPPQRRVEDMAATYLRAVRAVQPSGPYAFAGYSFGGLVAYEMARLVVDAGDDVEWLGLLDSNIHHACLPPLRRLAFVAGRPPHALRRRVALRTRVRRYRAERAAPRAPLAGAAPEVSPLLRRVRQACWAAFTAYRPAPYPGAATFIAATGPPSGDPVCRPLPAWRRLVRGGLDVHEVAGGHDDFIAEPHVGAVADAIAAKLS